MENQIPLYLEHYLQDRGVMSTEHEELDDPVNGVTVDISFSGPVGSFDEYGDPEW